MRRVPMRVCAGVNRNTIVRVPGRPASKQFIARLKMLDGSDSHCFSIECHRAAQEREEEEEGARLATVV